MGLSSAHAFVARVGAGRGAARLALGHALLALAFAAAYYLGGRLGTALRFPDNLIAPVWPPIAVAMTAMLLSPPRRWWLWVAAALPAHLALYLPLEVPLWRQSIQIGHNLSLGALAAAALHRLLDGPLPLSSLRDVGIFLGTIALLASLTSAWFVGIMVAVGAVPAFAPTWRLLNLSNLLTSVTLVPALVLLITRGRSWIARFEGWPAVESALLAASVLAVGGAVYGAQTPSAAGIPALVYAPLPLLLWAAIRFGPGGLSLAMTTLTLLALWQASLGRGPFLSTTPAQNTLNLQSYFLAFAGPLMLLAALVDERRRAAADLVQLNAELEARVAERTAELGRANRELAAARDQAEAARRAQGEFLATMSHELRTPLHTILGYSQLLVDSPALPPAQLAHARTVQQSAEHLLSTVSGVLELSRIEAGRQTLAATATAPARLLDDLAAMFQLTAESKGLRLRLVPAPDLPAQLALDAVKLRQVLINLVGNAVKFTHAGVVTVAARCEPCPAPGGPVAPWLIVAVADTGPGLAPDEQRAVFEAFVQTPIGQRVGEGSGLGLAVSRRLVGLMGGRLTLSSTPGHGAIFTVEVPAMLPPPGAPAGEARRRQPLALAPGQPPYRVLVIDDHEPNRLLLSRLLAALGFAVDEAGDGEAALERWRLGRHQLVLTDLRLPRLDGFAFTRELRAAQGQSAPVIIALSAGGFAEDRAAALAAGCDDFMRKPFRPVELVENIGRRLGARFEYAPGPPRAAPGAPAAPDLTALAALPPLQLAALAEATAEGDPRRIAAAIEALRPRAPGLAAALEALAEQVAFDLILEAARAAQQVSARHGTG